MNAMSYAIINHFLEILGVIRIYGFSFKTDLKGIKEQERNVCLFCADAMYSFMCALVCWAHFANGFSSDS